jgi:GNAT superfamily N-acetyltransferase
MSTVTIRQAERRDIPSIFALVQELALYENAPEAVITSVKTYEEDFDESHFEALVAEIEGEIIGMALYYMCFSTWKGKMLYLEDFVVKETHRRYGAGQLLFDAFLAKAKEKKCSLVKWQVLDWNEPAIRFYEKNNAIIEQEWWNGKIFLVDPTVAL